MTTPQPPEVPQKSGGEPAQVPLVTVGVPTHNAQAFVEQSLQSLLQLDYPRLEILINDNGSSDDTLDIVRRHTSGDVRVRLTAWPDDRGAVANFNHLMREAAGDYFMWASDHDLWDREYLTVLVSALQEDDAAVLAYTETVLIGEAGDHLEVMDDFVDVSASDPRARYTELIWHLGACNMVYGLMRREVLQSTWGVLPILGPDNLLLAQMAIRGTFVRVPRPMFRRRRNRAADEDEVTGRQAQMNRIKGTSSGTGSTPDSDIYRELRDQHLRLVHKELRGKDRWAADLATRHCFHVRLGVSDPVASVWHRLHRVARRGASALGSSRS